MRSACRHERRRAIAVVASARSCSRRALQASIGFGIGMLAAPIVAIVDPALIPGTLIMLATLVTLIVVVREREDIDLRGTGWALRRPSARHHRRGAAARRAARAWRWRSCWRAVVLVGVVLDQRRLDARRPQAQRRARRGDVGPARHRDGDRRPADGTGVAAQQRRPAARHDERLLPGRFGDVAGRAWRSPVPSTATRCGRSPC